ncbi:alkylation response protein AidB-like acyl-CoA dehydrogenase [Rhodococcus fascians]|uniref:acyl-CoA dehydrogenase family protein n=1 Tax=Nocardiaceae TaxID=85025 RepID=UPI000710375A|nr:MULTISPECIES: acyl-CoA dehydrogenase family protein [Rhodococcus]KQU32956.1 acyl-CoA dehydrogenase [Rhodococcus sp. Leaf233]MDR6908379.1 alkylation response protein AidB-like acyl-CoA dehydrogenase [Rhodococcus sp. 3258]MDR6930804.1 alkylation response protein AidB-like acyl-CoA dehydrogenase [Rhodococcus fascians]
MTVTQDAPPDAGSTATLDDVLVELAQRRTEFRDQRFVSPDFVARLKEIGIYRAATPRCFGGDPQAPADFLRTIEKISVVDGSTGWVASFGSALIYLAALPVDTQAELYAEGPDVVFAGGLFPVQPAATTDRGFLVDGRWKFASGSMGADILGVGIPGDDSTGGKPRTALLRPKDVEIVQEWDVVGMRGTGSFDLVVNKVEVAREWTFIRGGAATIDEPLYRYPTIAYAAQVLAVVGAGVARSALDYAVQVGAGRSGITGAPKLADRPYYRIAVAEAEAALRSARAYFYEVTDEVWSAVLNGLEPTDAQNAHLRLASTHLAKISAATAAKVVEISGTGAIYASHPLQQWTGDALVPQQHAFLGPAVLDAAGAVLMGLPPTVPGFK